MRSLDPEVMDAMWAAAEPLLPVRGGDHPLGCHNPRIADRVCLEGILIRLVTGCSWVTAERLIGNRASDTTLRARRDEWADAAVVFDALADEALRAYDRIVGLDLSEAAVDGSIHKAPCGGDGTDKSPVDRGKSGWKWSLLCDRAGIPVSWVADAANRNDVVLFEPTVAVGGGLPADVETLHLDRRYDYGAVKATAANHGIDDDVCAKRRKRGAAAAKTTIPLELRWAIARTNSLLSNFGQLRRNTDRRPRHRLAQLALAIALLLTAKLIDWRNRWSPT